MKRDYRFIKVLYLKHNKLKFQIKELLKRNEKFFD